MSWIAASALSTFLFSYCVILDKFVNKNKVKSVYSFAIILNTIYFIFILITTYFQRSTFVFGPGMLYSALAGLFWFFMWIFYWRALQQGEASRVAAIFFIQPIFSALAGVIFLQESLSILKWAGISAIVVGALMSSLGGETHRKEVKTAYLFAFLAAILSAIGNTVSKYAMASLPPLTVNCFSFYATIPLYLFLLKDKTVVKEVKMAFANTKLMLQFSVRGLLGYIAIILNMLAMSLGPISLVSAIGGTMPMMILITSLLLASLFPKLIHEELGKKALIPKFIALILTVAGVVMISV